MKRRQGEPFMPADVYGRSLAGLGINVIVRDVTKAVAFYETVLAATIVYADPDFAVVRIGAIEWMVHADHAYASHPLHGALSDDLPRGLGVEIRLHGVDPNGCERRASQGGYTVLAPAADKPHGLRECFILDPDGYLWVPDVPIAGKAGS